MKENPNCYKCKFRGDVPGSAHSSCKHPANQEILGNNLMEMFAIFASVGRAPTINAETGLNIVGNPTGIRKGWFNWPFNFDPVWLQNCDGFTPKEEDKDENRTV